jgi:anhydro-N-acetylmuramic acid kinase
MDATRRFCESGYRFGVSIIVEKRCGRIDYLYPGNSYVVMDLEFVEVVGIMSGSSLDGVDLAWCRFGWSHEGGGLHGFEIVRGQTMPLSGDWPQILSTLDQASGFELARYHTAFGHYLGELARTFMQEHDFTPRLIASHGHTIFHEIRGQESFTFQLGEGAAIAAESGLPVVSDFRTADVAVGGQGAPMVPIADTLLFPEYNAWLNIGGIANITLRMHDGSIKAWDITGANQILNALAREEGLEMDRGGAIALQGNFLPELAGLADAHEWFSLPPPKSLANQWVARFQTNIFSSYPAALPDRMHTAATCIARHIAGVLPLGGGTLLASGGGALNHFLMEQIAAMAAPKGWQIVQAEKQLLHYKEACMIALAGLLRWQGLPNFLPGVTGARRPVSGGALYLPPFH